MTMGSVQRTSKKKKSWIRKKSPRVSFLFFYGFTLSLTWRVTGTEQHTLQFDVKELQDKNSCIEACLKGQPVAWLPTKKTDHYRQDISKADGKKMPALEMLGPAKRKKHELQAESEDPETTGNEDREAASQGGEMKKPPKKARHDSSDTGESCEAGAGRQLEVFEDLEQPT